MFSSYLYPYYRYPAYGFPYGYPNWGYGGYPTNINYGSNVIGSAVANQTMNTIGFGAIGGTQIATPTVVW
jgi:hypothetical protein